MKQSPLYENVRVTCTIVSDTHIDIKHPMPWLPRKHLKASLKDAQEAVVQNDAYITVGDTTSRGSEVNWEMALGCFKKFTPAKNVLLTVGNHDCWSDEGYETAIDRYKKYYELICGEKRDNTYFSKIINGYRFIFIGNEGDSGCEAALSDEQIEWLSGEIAAAKAEDKPCFVFCHQSLNQKHGLPRTWDRKEDPNRDKMEGGLGVSSDEVEKILKSGKNVYYFSGHSHMGLCGENMTAKEGYSSFENDEGLWLINLPSLSCGNHHGEDKAMNIGVILEVYDDRVVIRPRNFRRRRYNTAVTIYDGKPYLEQIL